MHNVINLYFTLDKKKVSEKCVVLLDNAEQVDVGVVNGEVDGNESGSLSDPKPFLHLSYDGLGLVLQIVEVLIRKSCVTTYSFLIFTFS